MTYARSNLSNDCLDLIVDLLDGIGSAAAFRLILARLHHVVRYIFVVSGHRDLDTTASVLHAHVELPPLQRFARVDARHDHDEPLNVPIGKPRFHLRHHLTEVGQEPLVGGRKDGGW